MSTEVQIYAGRVADYLEKHGWTQGTYGNEDGECCILGAMNRVYDIDAYTNLADAIQDRIKDGIVAWNDAPERTKDDVIGVLRSIQRGEAA